MVRGNRDSGVVVTEPGRRLLHTNLLPLCELHNQASFPCIASIANPTRQEVNKLPISMEPDGGGRATEAST